MFHKRFFSWLFRMLSVLWWFIGCAADFNTSFPFVQCTLDVQCGEHMVCGPIGQCIPLRDPLEIPLGIEIYDQRPNSPQRGKLIQDLGPTELVPDENGVLYITLPNAFTVEGTVRTESVSASVQALLLSYRLSHIPGRGVTSSSQSLGRVNAGGVPYEITLTQPDFYVFQVIPQPAIEFAPLIAYGNYDRNSRLDFTLGVVNYEVIGRVVDTNGLPVPNVTVWIFDYATGASSTVAITSALPDTQGQFRCVFTNRPQSLAIYTGAGSTGMVLPSVLFEISSEDLEQWHAEHVESGYHTGDLVIPALAPPITFGTNVFGTASSGAREAIAGARVTFRSIVGGGTQDNGVIVAEGTTNALGDVTLELVPGNFETSRTYEVTVTPPLDSPFATTRKTIEVGPYSGYGESIELTKRIRVVGTVRSPSGEPLAQVTVKAAVATTSSGLPNEAMVGTPYQPSTQTDSTGTFTLTMDPGYYDFSLIFPDKYKYPNTTFQDIIISDAMEAPLEFNAPSPAMIRVVVQDEVGRPLPSMELRAFQISSDCPLAGECAVPAQLLSTARTDVMGTAALILP